MTEQYYSNKAQVQYIGNYNILTHDELSVICCPRVTSYIRTSYHLEILYTYVHICIARKSTQHKTIINYLFEECLASCTIDRKYNNTQTF